MASRAEQKRRKKQKRKSRAHRFHARGLELLHVWVPRDLKARIVESATARQQDVQVVVNNALLKEFPANPLDLLNFPELPEVPVALPPQPERTEP